ncbi:hypothetical protein CCACVL1_26309 [Corchorus capsularis]|uniref:Uncharacterized protein n=1 Tax=Corchorus capsularis TaxID=210143 RepID=A0A1R3GF95_COCAP|nr:hypothetical protein CCACVL1_26309 [Corchorus capsularis]
MAKESGCQLVLEAAVMGNEPKLAGLFQNNVGL